MIHCHAVYATMFALAHEPIPAVIEEFVVYVGGDVPSCEYKATGSDELGDEVAVHARRPRGRAHGQPRPGRRRQVRRRRAAHRPSSSSATPRSCGAPRRSAASSTSPDKVSTDFAGVYRFIRDHMWTLT